MGEPSNSAALGAAVAYPLGVVGVILAILVIRKILARPADMEEKETEDHNHPYIAAFQLHNPGIYHKTIKDLALHSHTKFVISRLWRDGKVTIPTGSTELLENDRILVVTTEKDMPTLTLLFGEQENRDWNQEDIDWNSIDRTLVSEHIVVTQAEINGKRLGSLHLRNTYDINISRVLRSGVQILATPDLILQLGDRLTVVGEKNGHQARGRHIGQLRHHTARTQSGRHFHRHRAGIDVGFRAAQHAGYQQSGKDGVAGALYRGNIGRLFRPAPAHAHLYDPQCQPDVARHRAVPLSGRYWH